ncbi:MAG: lysophospholipid acyltransferase family protein [Pseudomonadota bacterium]
MLERLNHAWRLFATALSFTCFGLGGLTLWVVVFPILSLFVRDPQRLSIVARGVIHGSFRVFIGLMHQLGILTYEVRGLEKLQRRGLLILANHPSLIDVVFLMAFTDRADCVVKASLVGNPFTRGPVLAAGFICNNVGPGMVEDGVASLRAGNNLIIFPEGTRTPAAGFPTKLQRGASNVAVRSGVDITPVVIHCTQSMLAKGTPWWRIPSQKPHFQIEVRDDLPVTLLTERCANDALAARRLTDHLTDYFAMETRRDHRHANP